MATRCLMFAVFFCGFLALKPKMLKLVAASKSNPWYHASTSKVNNFFFSAFPHSTSVTCYHFMLSDILETLPHVLDLVLSPAVPWLVSCSGMAIPQFMAAL